MEIKVLLSVPELTNNPALVYISPDSRRVRIEPTPRWSAGMVTLVFNRPSGGGMDMDRGILEFYERLSLAQRSLLPASIHAFPPIPHLGLFTLHTTYLTTPHFQFDELGSLLSSRFISLDLEGFVPTLDKNKQRASLSGSSSLLNSSEIRSMLSRSPLKAIEMGRTTSTGSEPIVTNRTILLTRVPSMGAPMTTL